MFIREGNTNQADYEENICRATACEMIARRITHMISRHRLPSVMSTRFRYLEPDGDISPAVSALETAIDQHCTVRRPNLRSSYGRSSSAPTSPNRLSRHSGRANGSSETMKTTTLTMSSITWTRTVAPFGTTSTLDVSPFLGIRTTSRLSCGLSISLSTHRRFRGEQSMRRSGSLQSPRCH